VTSVVIPLVSSAGGGIDSSTSRQWLAAQVSKYYASFSGESKPMVGDL
jgi:hypothetical protein